MPPPRGSGGPVIAQKVPDVRVTTHVRLHPLQPTGFRRATHQDRGPARDSRHLTATG